MTLRELQDRALRLSAEERWQSIDALMRSLQPKPRSKVKPKGLATSLIGIAKTDAPPPTDAEVKAMLDEQKYLYITRNQETAMPSPYSKIIL